MKVRKIFVDMDGVLVDFDKHREELGLDGDIVKAMPDAYALMDPIPGALDGIRALINLGYDVFIATKPPTGVPHAYQDKVKWIMEHIPELTRKIIITHHKGLLGGERDFLIDDRPFAAFCEEFEGTLIYFRAPSHWPLIVDYFEGLAIIDDDPDAIEKAFPKLLGLIRANKGRMT